MISSAIQSSLVMIPIILIVHLLLKHILIDKMNDRPQPLLKYTTHKNKNENKNENQNMMEKKKREEVDVEREKEEEEEDRGDKGDNNKKRETEGHKDEEIYLKKRLARLQEEKEKEKKSNKKTYGPSPKVKFQERRPAESDTKLIPEKDDVFSFVLQGDPSPPPFHSSSPYSSPSHDVHSMKNKSHSYYNEPHYPKPDSRNELFEDNKERGREIASNHIEMGEISKMGEMGEMYSDHMFTKKGVSDNTDLFNNIGAANFDGEETSLDEIFRQTQVPNTK